MFVTFIICHKFQWELKKLKKIHGLDPYSFERPQEQQEDKENAAKPKQFVIS